MKRRLVTVCKVSLSSLYHSTDQELRLFPRWSLVPLCACLGEVTWRGLPCSRRGVRELIGGRNVKNLNFKLEID
jgi:hypothetical protein